MIKLTNKIKEYKGWNVERIETVVHFNSRQTQYPMFFRRTDTQELYKRGYVVSLRHEQGGEAKTLLKSKFDVQEFVNFIK